MGFNPISIVHLFVAFCIIIELGFTGWLVNVSNGHSATLNFMLFNSVWTIVILLYLAVIPFVFERLYHGMVSLTLSGVTMLFWFAGSIALADHVGTHDCHGNRYCQVLKAATAFGFFIWASFVGLLVVDCMAFLRGGARIDSTRKPGQVRSTV